MNKKQIIQRLAFPCLSLVILALTVGSTADRAAGMLHCNQKVCVVVDEENQEGEQETIGECLTQRNGPIETHCLVTTRGDDCAWDDCSTH